MDLFPSTCLDEFIPVVVVVVVGIVEGKQLRNREIILLDLQHQRMDNIKHCRCTAIIHPTNEHNHVRALKGLCHLRQKSHSNPSPYNLLEHHARLAEIGKVDVKLAVLALVETESGAVGSSEARVELSDLAARRVARGVR